MTRAASQKWASRYLQRGFAQDSIVFARREFGPRGATCQFTVKPGHEGPKPFHLSAITAHRVVAELAIEFICDLTKMTKEQIGEVWQLRHDVSYRVRITRRQSLQAADT